MPIIPLLNKGETVKTADVPKPVLDTLRRPSVDLSGVVSAQGRLGKSAQRPDVPLAIGAAPYDALGSVGQAIERTGSIVGAVALKRQEAETFNQDFETQLALKDAAGEMRSVYENPQIPPAEYETERQKIRARLADQFDSRKDLTPEARQKSAQRLQVWDVDSRHDTNLKRTTGEFKLARDNTRAVLDDAAKNGKDEQFTEAKRLALDNGWIDKYEGAQWDKIQEDHRKRRKTDELIAAAQRDPDDIKKFLLEQEDGKFKNATELSGSERLSVISIASAASRQKVQATADTVADMMATDPNFTVEKLRPLLVELRPGDAQVVEQEFLKVQGQKINRHNLRPEVWQPRWLELRKQIEEFDANAPNAVSRYLSIQQNLEVLPTGQDTLLRKMVNAKYEASQYDAETSLKALGKFKIHQAHEDQQLGETWSKRATAADDATAMGLLATSADPAKDAAGWMKEIGISKEDAEAIKAAPDARSKMMLFQTAWEGLDKKDRDEAMAEFSLVDREKIARLLKSPDVERVDTDEAAKSRSAQRGAELDVHFDVWFESMKAKGPVTETMVKEWFAKETGASMRTQQVPALIGRPISTRAVPNAPPMTPAPAVTPQPPAQEPDKPPPKTSAKEEADALKGMTDKQLKAYRAAEVIAKEQGVPFLTKAQQLKQEEEERRQTNISVLPVKGDRPNSGYSLLPDIPNE